MGLDRGRGGKLREGLTYANVVSTLALFLVVAGGSAIAANQLAKDSVGSKQLKKNAVGAENIKKDAVTSEKIADGAVTTDRIAPDAVTGAKLNEATLGEVPSARTAANAGALGGRNSDAFQQRIRWALVDYTGNIVAQSGGVSNNHNPGICTPGCDILDFGEDVKGKAIILSTATGALGGDTHRAGVCGGVVSHGTATCSVGNDTSHVLVRSANSTGADGNSSYWIAVIG